MTEGTQKNGNGTDDILLKADIAALKRIYPERFPDESKPETLKSQEEIDGLNRLRERMEKGTQRVYSGPEERESLERILTRMALHENGKNVNGNGRH